jgi:formiminotetrahydrofolate cyclodeaminase
VNESDFADQRLGSWLYDLASAAPAPGGGAAAALHVAVGAALVEMVCNLTIGKPRYAEHETTMVQALEQAGELRARALLLADADAEAFLAVSRAYKMPKDTEEERDARAEAIQSALVTAADVPLRTAEAAADVIGLAQRILEGANVNVISDVAVAASSARAGLEAATVNVEINLSGMADNPERSEVAARLEARRDAVLQADRVVRDVTQKIAS